MTNLQHSYQTSKTFRKRVDRFSLYRTNFPLVKTISFSVRPHLSLFSVNLALSVYTSRLGCLVKIAKFMRTLPLFLPVFTSSTLVFSHWMNGERHATGREYSHKDQHFPFSGDQTSFWWPNIGRSSLIAVCKQRCRHSVIIRAKRWLRVEVVEILCYGIYFITVKRAWINTDNIVKRSELCISALECSWNLW